MRTSLLLSLAAASLASRELAAQCPSANCSPGLTTSIVPSFRGAPCTEFAGWLNTCQATAPNFPDEGASTTDDATLTQLDPNSFVTVTCNLYSFRAIQQFRIDDRSPGDLQELLLQTRAGGTPLDPQSFALLYTDAQSVVQRVAPASIAPLGTPEELVVTWDLAAIAGLVQSYSVRFDALGTSCSLEHVRLDTRSAPRALCADRETLSRTGGGLQTLVLDAGSAHGGRLYAILGSASGTSPGLSFGPGLDLELAFDAYMITTLQLANSTYLRNTVGHLDALGRAQAGVALPALSLMFDATLHHGFVVFDAAEHVVATSNAQVLNLRR